MRGCLIERSPNGVLNSQKDDAKQINGEETQKQQNMLFSSQEYAEKMQKENLTLIKALAHRNKIIELSGIEFQKLRINLRNVQEKNLQLAQANSQMLAELNSNRDRLKTLQHELGCKNVLLKARKMQLEEQALPCINHALKDKVPANASDEECKSFQVHDMNHRDTKRKQTPNIKPSGSSNVKPINVKEKVNSKRRVSGVIDPTIIPEETSQTEDDIETMVVSQGSNQIVDNVINKKFVLDTANSVEDNLHSKRQCARRRSTRFDVQETEQSEKLLEMVDDGAKETKETTRLSSRRRSARLRPEEEAELCESFNEREEVREENIKKRRVSSRRESKMFDFQEPEVTESLIADNARSLIKEESEAVEPSENRNDTKEPNAKRRVSTRRQSAKGKSQTAIEKTEEAAAIIKEIATDPSLHNDKAQECDHAENNRESESKKKKTRAEESETEGGIRRTSVESEKAVKPSENRDDMKEPNAKRRISTRRQSAKAKSQTATEKTDEVATTIKEIATDQPLRDDKVQECNHTEKDCERESKKKKPKAEETKTETKTETETEEVIRRTSVGRPSRHAAEKVHSYKEVSLKVKMRRNC